MITAKDKIGYICRQVNPDGTTTFKLIEAKIKSVRIGKKGTSVYSDKFRALDAEELEENAELMSDTGKAKYCRIPIRSRLFETMQDGGELNAEIILSMPHEKAVAVIDAIMADWFYWMRRAGEYFVQLTPYSDDDCESWCVLGPCTAETPSNGDKIRRMTDEELAEWLDLLVNRAKIYGENKVWLEDTPRYYTDWLDWLRQEASDG